MFKKPWEIVDEKGNVVEPRWWRYKNARYFAEEMNKWSPAYFDGKTFTVRRRDASKG